MSHHDEAPASAGAFVGLHAVGWCGGGVAARGALAEAVYATTRAAT
jgi:hypothetical protein